ncbi:hypothetical protein [Spongiibacter tropicus]|uniref:hypothetical protein n=1 Tax=Spongiibacter tropicus TaxID=454602 RepID=UPI0035BE57F2
MRYAVILFTLAACAGLSACASGQYDAEREWRLRECEKILYEEDRSACMRNTPHYIQ